MAYAYELCREDGKDEPFMCDSLKNALDQAFHVFGADYRAREQQVRSALSVGKSRCLIHAPDGYLVLSVVKKDFAPAELGEDGRLRTFYATAYINKWGDSALPDTIAEREVSAEGLINLFQKVAEFALEKIGGLPDCMTRAEVESRLPTVRTQLGRKRAWAGANEVRVSFPSNRHGQYFHVERGLYSVIVVFCEPKPKRLYRIDQIRAAHEAEKKDPSQAE